MKIATYNINGVNGRLPILLRWLEEDEPDIVCLQELKAPNDRFPRRELQRLGYEAVWHGQKSWNGVAILAKVHRAAALNSGPDAAPPPYLANPDLEWRIRRFAQSGPCRRRGVSRKFIKLPSMSIKRNPGN